MNLANFKIVGRGVLAAAIGGAVTGAAGAATDAKGKTIASAAIAGALIAVAHLFQNNPAARP